MPTAGPRSGQADCPRPASRRWGPYWCFDSVLPKLRFVPLELACRLLGETLIVNNVGVRTKGNCTRGSSLDRRGKRKSPPCPEFMGQDGDLFRRKEQLHQTLIQHRVGYFYEAADVGAVHQVAGRAVFLGRFVTVLMDGDHDLVKTVVDFVPGPAQACAVLGHFEA